MIYDLGLGIIYNDPLERLTTCAADLRSPKKVEANVMRDRDQGFSLQKILSINNRWIFFLIFVIIDHILQSLNGGKE